MAAIGTPKPLNPSLMERVQDSAGRAGRINIMACKIEDILFEPKCGRAESADKAIDNSVEGILRGIDIDSMDTEDVLRRILARLTGEN